MWTYINSKGEVLVRQMGLFSPEWGPFAFLVNISFFKGAVQILSNVCDVKPKMRREPYLQVICYHLEGVIYY